MKVVAGSGNMVACVAELQVVVESERLLHLVLNCRWWKAGSWVSEDNGNPKRTILMIRPPTNYFAQVRQLLHECGIRNTDTAATICDKITQLQEWERLALALPLLKLCDPVVSSSSGVSASDQVVVEELANLHEVVREQADQEAARQQ
ncbi:hypothetical protein LIER_02563 [Lithospermum erythrorhizon]|uniref:Uncharacterized protein n=1 Tax=Lithospermum erythrorhizon TaxID=34254 RepID=A0AAV3NRF1_LITER